MQVVQRQPDATERVPANGKFDSYLTNYYDHTATKRALEWNAMSALDHHGRHFPADKSAAVLEIGPGYGHTLRTLRAQGGYTNIRAVDVSPEVVQHCNRLYPGSTDLAADTAAYLQARAESFDLILMFHVLEHLTKDEGLMLLQSVRCALRTGGKLVVEVPNMDNPVVGLRNRYADFTHMTGYVDQSLAQALRMAGFSNVVVYGCKIIPKNPLRLLQRVAQDAIELLYFLPRRVYGLHSVSTSLLAACVTK